LTSTHVDGIATPTCEELTFDLTGLPSDGTLSVSGTDITATGTVPAGADQACVAGTLAGDDDTDTAIVDYTPNDEFNGADSFTYNVAHSGAFSGDVTVNITVAAVDDDAVAAGDQTVITAVDAPVVVTLAATDIDTCEITFTATSPVNGTVGSITDATCASNDPQTDTTPNSDSASVTFTPNSDFQGTGSFTFTADGGGTPDATTVTVTVGSVPVAADQTVTTQVNTDIVVTLVATDADPPHCDLTFTATSPTNGTLGSVTDAACTAGTPNSDSATVTFTPTTDFQGTGSFTFSAADTTDTAATTVTVTIGSTPVADAQSVTTDLNTSVVITLTGSDADSADCELTFAIVSGPTIGTLGAINNAACVSGTPNTDSATVTLVPNLDAQGSDSFTFSVNDGNKTTTATVTITVGVAPGLLTAVQGASTSNADNVTLTGSTQNLPGASCSVTTPGTYTIIGVFDFANTSAVDGRISGRLSQNGSTIGIPVARLTTDDNRQTVEQVWVRTISGATTFQLQADKNGAGGNAVAVAAQTTITCIGPF
jgi:hypothetical protein